MPSAYVLAKDNLEQARAILGTNVWFDAKFDHLISCAILRLEELDSQLHGGRPPALETISLISRDGMSAHPFRKPD